MSRGAKVKDVDWAKVAGTLDVESATKPAPIKINPNEVISKVKKATFQKVETSNLIDTKGRFQEHGFH